MNIKDQLQNCFNEIYSIFDSTTHSKILKYLKDIKILCDLNLQSKENRRLRSLDQRKIHPIKVKRGDVFNANITEGVGSELCGNHLVIIIQNKKGNMYSEKVNVIYIEGDGNSINPNYQMSLSNEDLLYGQLDKDPSRIIFSDINTIDKARLSRKIGTIKPEVMEKIDIKIKDQLNLK